MTTETLPVEIEHLDPQPRVITLVSGTQCRVVPLKLQELMAMFRILTRGAGPNLARLNLDLDDMESLVVNLLSAIAFAVPEAGREVTEFVQIMVEPLDHIKKPINKNDQEKNLAGLTKLYEELANPELQDTLEIIQNVFVNEKANLVSLGKQIGVLLKMMGLSTPDSSQNSKSPSIEADSSVTTA